MEGEEEDGEVRVYGWVPGFGFGCVNGVFAELENNREG